MANWPLRSIFIVSLLVLSGPIQSQEELPFWRKKPRLYKKILESRKVVVSVDDQVSPAGAKQLRIMGVGAVNVPLSHAVKQVMEFEKLPSVSSYFKKVVHKPEKKEVYFFLKALGYEVRFVQRYRWGKSTNTEAQLDWHVISGRLKGMVGHYQFRKVKPAQTEVTMWASVNPEQVPLPAFFRNFMLEVIAEKTAKKMRTFIEESYRQSGGPNVRK